MEIFFSKLIQSYASRIYSNYTYLNNNIQLHNNYTVPLLVKLNQKSIFAVQRWRRSSIRSGINIYTPFTIA